MLILIFIIVVAICIISYKKADWYRDNGWCWICVISIATMIVVLAIAGSVGNDASKLIIADQQIAMYEDQNSKIETEISDMVKQYMTYENGTFKAVTDCHESPVTLVTLYPELKSDTLVQNEIAVYTANNSKISELKNNKLNYSLDKWWLCFCK